MEQPGLRHQDTHMMGIRTSMEGEQNKMWSIAVKIIRSVLGPNVDGSDWYDNKITAPITN